MKIDKVSKLSARKRFFYWIAERHDIHLRRTSGEKKPWTDDKILQEWFFTNPYRENDRVTVWFRENVRDPLRFSSQVILATVIFRWFNLPETGLILKESRLLTNWDSEHALKILGAERDRGKKIFTGAFMINSPPGIRKLEAICERIDNVWADKSALIPKLEACTTLEEAHKALTQYPGLGGFMAYEVITDLRWTYLLENATDILTWCNPGPGCIRGILRIQGKEDMLPEGNAQSPPLPKDWREVMASLLEESKTVLTEYPALEMREIEHSLCEWDKYERARRGDGRCKRRYAGA